MTVFGTPGRLVSWAKRCPQTRQSGKKTSSGKAGKGNPWLNGILGEIAASASRTSTFLGERYRRLARRRGKRKALTAIARSILVIKPVGLVYDDDGMAVTDPDAEVQAAVADIFACFLAAGSAYGVVAAFAGRKFPQRAYGGVWAGQLRWAPLTHHRVLQAMPLSLS